MNEITDTTCEFGLARTSEGCVRTLQSFDPEGYKWLQISCMGLGLLALGVSSYKFFCSKRNNGAKLQQRAFLLSMYAAATFVIRGVDPLCFGHYFPRPIGQFIVDSCTASLFTVFIMTLMFWNFIIHKGTPEPEKSATRVKILSYTMIALIWGAKIAVSVAFLWTKGFDSLFNTIELLATAALLLVLCVVFAVYGVRVIRRLEHIDKMNEQRLNMYDKLNTSRIDKLGVCRTSAAGPNDPNGSALLPMKPMDGTMPDPPLLEPKKRKPARKIKETLIIIETVLILCIIAQIYTGIHRRNTYLELQCANGFNCDRISIRLTLLPGFQYVAIYCVLYSFRKTKSDRNAAGRLGIAQPVQIV